MSKNKVVHPVMEERFLIDLWPGYKGERVPGKFFVLEWPVEHPNSHCSEGSYVPNRRGTCEGCGWIPEDKVCCDECGKPSRDQYEIVLLTKIIDVHTSNHPQGRMVLAAYQEYVVEYSDKLVYTPRLLVVIDWFNSLKKKKREKILEKYNADGPVLVRIEIISSRDMFEKLVPDEEDSQMFYDAAYKIFLNAPTEVLESIIDDPCVPDEMIQAAKDVLTEREESEEEEKEE